MDPNEENECWDTLYTKFKSYLLLQTTDLKPNPSVGDEASNAFLSCIDHIYCCDLESHFRKHPDWIKTFRLDCRDIALPFFIILFLLVDKGCFQDILEFDGAAFESCLRNSPSSPSSTMELF